MRPDLPWNVAGIPSEAREAARAAARREGLSVGEWLTRRIVRDLTGASETLEPARETYSPAPTFQPDPAPVVRSEPPPARPEPVAVRAEPVAVRAEPNDVLARAARTDSDTQEVFKRIETHLSGLGRRLEATERSTADNNRAMSKAATEINIAAREQAQAFDQLSAHVVSLSGRIERVEKGASDDHMKDAVKTLHQGLARLAEQIAQTSQHSATQIETLASNLESLADKIADVRTSAEGATRTNEQRLAMLDDRVRVVERVSHSSADALDKALENMEARNQARADEAADIHRRVGGVEHLNDALDRLTSRFASSEAQTSAAIARMEDTILKLDGRGNDPAIDRRLNSIERTLGDIVAKIDGPSNADESIRRLIQRLDAVEIQQEEMAEQVAEHASAVASAPQPAPDASVYAPQPAFAQQAPVPPTAAPGPVFDAPPFPDPVSNAPKTDPFADAFSPAFAPPAHGADATASSVFGDFGPQDAFATQPAFDAAATFSPAAPSSNPPPPATNESFLAAARRSAQAAAVAADTERSKGFGGFNWRSNSGGSATATAEPAPSMAPPVVLHDNLEHPADDETRPNRTRYFLIGGVALVVILAITAIILSQNAGVSQAEHHTGIGAMFQKKAPAQAVQPTAPKATVVPYTPSDQTPPASTQTQAPPADSFSAVPPKPTAPNATTAQTQTPAPTTALDKLTAMANSGNAKAELLIGLKYVDGEGVPANDVQGAKWLQKAAAQNEPVAAYRLGTLYERGKGVTADATQATHWYQVAAQAGNRKAMHNLAVAYAQGSGATKNFTEAARWFSKAATLGLSDSQFNLAVLYERGLGVPQSLADAYKWYAIAASQGDTESKARIDALTTQLSAEDRAAAQRSADMFKPAALDRRANVAPDVAEVTR